MQLKELKLTLLFDNVACDARLERLWGFACLVETPDVRLLFDTGSNGRLLLRNMNALGLNPAALDSLFVSHAHWDHIGGLDSVLELNPALELIVPESLSPRMRSDLETLCTAVTVVDGEPRQIGPDLASTGTLPGDMPEQALVITTDQGAVVITGCAHPGIATIAEQAARQTGAPIALLAGGFHLFEADAVDIDAVGARLERLGIGAVLPTHCTGDAAMIRLQERFGGRFLPGGVGQIIRFDAAGQPMAESSSQAPSSTS